MQFPEDVSEYHEVPVVVSRDEGNTQKTPEYGNIIDLYITNIYKMIRINGGPSTRQLVHPTLKRLEYSPNNFLINVKSTRIRHKTFQLISRAI